MHFSYIHDIADIMMMMMMVVVVVVVVVVMFLLLFDRRLRRSYQCRPGPHRGCPLRGHVFQHGTCAARCIRRRRGYLYPILYRFRDITRRIRYDAMMYKQRAVKN